MRSVDIAESERPEVAGLAENVLAVLNGSGADTRLIMAALAEAGARAAESDNSAAHTMELAQ
jgi:hypothetical protein